MFIPSTLPPPYDKRQIINDLLMNELNDSITNLIVGKEDGADGMNVYSVKDHDTRTYIRNPDLWCNELVSQLTGIVAYKRCLPIGYYLVESGGGIMITPRHGIGCRHFHPFPSGTWDVNNYGPFDALHRYVKEDGTVISRQQIGHGYYLPDNPNSRKASTDLFVYLLDESVPNGVHIMPIVYIPGGYVIDSEESEGTLRIHATQGVGRDRGGEGPPPSPASDYPQYNDSMICIRSIKGNGSVPTGYKYNAYTGDSGGPLLINKSGILYLYSIMITSGDGQQQRVHNNAGIINELISICDTDAISRGLLSSPTGLLPTYIRL